MPCEMIPGCGVSSWNHFFHEVGPYDSIKKSGSFLDMDLKKLQNYFMFHRRFRCLFQTSPQAFDFSLIHLFSKLDDVPSPTPQIHSQNFKKVYFMFHRFRCLFQTSPKPLIFL